ncbi:MAG: YggT family protein [Eubacteriales bacterium]
MHIIGYVIVNFVNFILTVLQILMFARAIISWFPMEEENKITSFLYASTEPIIVPVRNILSRFSFFNSMPIDMSFLVAFILIGLVQNLLSLVRL